MPVILFDLDGTLVDSRADLTTASNVARQVCGFEALSLNQVTAMVGDGIQALLERLCPNVDEDTFVRARAAFVDCYEQVCCDQTAPYDGIAESLAILSDRSVSLAVVSNKPTHWAQRIVDSMGFGDLFPVVVGGDQGKKPDPKSLMIALEALGNPTGSRWMVGDHTNDISAGRAAGLRTCWCAWGFAETDETPDRQIIHPSDLQTLIEA